MFRVALRVLQVALDINVRLSVLADFELSQHFIIFKVKATWRRRRLPCVALTQFGQCNIPIGRCVAANYSQNGHAGLYRMR